MHLRHPTLLCLALLGSAAFAAPALAQDHHAMPDPDGDGMVSAAEHAAAAQAMFAKADANHDGMLSHEEMMAAHAPMGMGMDGHAMQEGKKMGCCCCGGGEGGMQACGMGDKKDPIGEAMSGQ